MSNVVSTTNLQKSYKAKLALNDCSFDIPVGSVTALVGPNGAGKTTLLDIIAGLLNPSDGKIQLFESISPGSLQALQRLSFVAQNSTLNRNMTVIDTVRLTNSLNANFDLQYALLRLEKLEIPLKRRIGKLSGGMQAQVALTLAIAKQPELLILDEPLSSLDSLARQQFLSELMVLVATSDLSVIFSSHSISELEKVCDYLVLIVEGKIILCNSIEQIINSHKTITCAPIELDHQREIEIIERNLGTGFATHLVKVHETFSPQNLELNSTTLENIILAYLRRGQEVTSLNISINL